MRSSLLFVPSLLLVGCGDNIDPAADEQTAISEDDHVEQPPEPEPVPTPAREFFATFNVSTISCDAPIGLLEGGARYADDQSVVTDAVCQFHFRDGLIRDGCTIEHEFASGGAHDVLL